jgi:Zn-dependent protease
LPENHECAGMEKARTAKTEPQTIVVGRPRQFEYSVSYEPRQTPAGRVYFGFKEVKHLAAAVLMVIGVGLSITMFPSVFSNSIDYFIITAFTAILTISFFIHELAHKITAQRHGLWAEFRLNLLGTALTIVSIVLPGGFFKIIAPGAVVVAGNADKQRMGRIAIAGPATNLILSGSLLAAATSLLAINVQVSLILLIGGFFNAWLALFNLIPFSILDGLKIFTWDKRIWAVAFAASVILTITAYMLLSL